MKTRSLFTAKNMAGCLLLLASIVFVYFFRSLYSYAELLFRGRFPQFYQDVPILAYNVAFHLLTAMAAFFFVTLMFNKKVLAHEVKENLYFQSGFGVYRHVIYNYVFPLVRASFGMIAELFVYFIHFWSYSFLYLFFTNKKDTALHSQRFFKKVRLLFRAKFKDSFYDNFFISVLHAINIVANPFPQTRAIVGSVLTMLYTISVTMISYNHGTIRGFLKNQLLKKSRFGP